MPQLSIVRPDGSQQLLMLNQQEPITIGRHSSNTIVIDHVDIPMLLARILWNKRIKAFEITAASDIDLNISGQSVRTAQLVSGNTLVVAGTTIHYEADVGTEAWSADMDRGPFPETRPETVPEPAEVEPERKEKSKKSRREKSKESPARTVEESAAAGAGLHPYKTTPEGAALSDRPLELGKPAEEFEEESVRGWLTRPRRPGERDPLRSPLVTTVTIVGVFLLIAIAAVALLVGRQNARRDYEAAVADREAGKFGQALQRYQSFLENHPVSRYADAARIELGLTRIDQSLNRAGADLAEALTQLEQFSEQHRQRKDFRNWYPNLTIYSQRIALEAYRQGSRQHDPQFLELGDRARLSFSRYKATDGSNDDEEADIEKASRLARADLLEFEVRRQSLALMDEQLASAEVDLLLGTFRQAVARYARFAREPEFLKRVQQALEMTRKSVQSSLSESVPPGELRQPNSAAVTGTTKLPAPILLIEKVNARLDIPSDGQTVWLLSEGNCLGIDRMTGLPRWSHHLGVRIPFEPVEVQTRTTGWLLPVGDGRGLMLVERDSGKPLWSLSLAAAIAHQPVIVEGTAYLCTSDRRLLAIELASGEITGGMLFPQELSAPVCVLDERLLLGVGTQDVLFVIDRHRWECVEARYLGHAPGTIRAQPFLLDEQIVVLENDQLRASRLHVLSRSENNWEMVRLQTDRLPGLAIGPPVLWGDRLFLETYGPRVAVWQLADTPGRPFLERITVAPIPFAEDTRLRIAPVEGDRLLVAGETLRELVLLTSSFEQKEFPVVLGRASQSLQTAGTAAHLAGRHSEKFGTTFLHFDFEQAESYWRVKTGTDPVRFLPDPDRAGNSRCVNAEGQVFDLQRLRGGDVFRWIEPTEALFDNTRERTERPEPVHVSGGAAGQLTVATRGTRVRVLNPPAGVVASSTLAGRPEIEPVLLENQLVWGDQRGIHCTPLSQKSTPVDSWLFPVTAGELRPIVWNEIVATGTGTLLAVHDQRRVLSLDLRSAQERRYLGEANSLQLDADAVGRGCLAGEQYLLGLASGELQVIEASALVVQQRIPLPATPTAGPWRVGDLILIELNQTTLYAARINRLNEPVWQLPLESGPLAIAPFEVSETHLLLACHDGSLLVVERESGKIQNQLQTPLPLAAAPLIVGESILWGLKSGAVQTVPIADLLGR